jgi:hypothetical protein
MTGDASSKARGTIVKVPDATPGLLFVNGQQMPFTMEGVWKSPVAPAANMTVDVEFDGSGAITSITVVTATAATSQIMNKEKFNELSGVAQEKGKEAAKLAEQGIGALAARMGTVALASAVVVWIAWFFLPAVSLNVAFLSKTFTFWQSLGFDVNDPGTFDPSGVSHGIFSLLGLLCIIAPFVAPFIKDPRAKYLNALPLIYIVIAVIMVRTNIGKVAGGMGGSVSDLFSFSWGLYLLGIAALVLGLGALKKPGAATA